MNDPHGTDPTKDAGGLERSAGAGLDSLGKRTHARAAEIVLEATPANTRRARAGALAYFEAWAQVAHGDAPWPVPVPLMLDFLISHLDGLPVTIEVELVRLGVKKPGAHSLATIEARIAHLSKAHRVAGFESPASDERIRQVLSAARRQRARSGGQTQADAIALAELERLLATCDATPRGLRDRAMLMVGWAAGGRRRSELVTLDVDDLRTDGTDYVWTLRVSKTDQTGQGHAVPIAGRAAEALTAWFDVSRITEGPVFRAISRWGHLSPTPLSAEAFRLLIKRRALAAGMDPSRNSPHGLRAGFMTEAGRQGIPLPETMALSGHKTPGVAIKYHRAGDVLLSRAARLAG